MVTLNELHFQISNILITNSEPYIQKQARDIE